MLGVDQSPFVTISTIEVNRPWGGVLGEVDRCAHAEGNRQTDGADDQPDRAGDGRQDAVNINH